MIKKIKKILKNKKGVMENTHIVLISIIFLTVFIFFIDIMMFTRTYIGMSNFLEGMTRSISIQGSIYSSTPSQFPGGSNMYLTKSEISDRLLDTSRIFKIKDDTVTMYVQAVNSNNLGGNLSHPYDYIIKSNTSSFKPTKGVLSSNNIFIDYGQPIKTGLSYRYRTMLGNINIEVKIYKNGISEYKHRDSTWDNI